MIQHCTLNTGHTRMSDRREVGAEAISALAPLLTPGLHQMPSTALADYRVDVSISEQSLIATVLSGDRPLATITIAPDDEAADDLWPQIESLYLSVSDMPGLRSADFAAPKRPAVTPWCAAIIIYATPDEAQWLGDFERCLAWAWIKTINTEDNAYGD